MRNILLHINEHKKIFSKHVFFDYIRNINFPIDKKLSFLPEMAYFIMSFGDINRYVIPFTNPKDEFERAVNKHAEEDSNHWRWYLSDLEDMNFNQKTTLIDSLKFLWSTQLSPSRKLVYELISLLANRPVKIRLAIIEAIEATGHVTFSILKKITNDLPDGKTLKFCGDVHLNHETGHTMCTDSEIIKQLCFSLNEIETTNILVDKCFQSFHGFMDQLYLQSIRVSA